MISGCYRGDQQFVKEQLTGTRTVLDWFIGKQRPDGLMGTILVAICGLGKGFPIRHARVTQMEIYLITLQYIEALRYGAELEALEIRCAPTLSRCENGAVGPICRWLNETMA
jgi:hypothetical protein